MLNFDFNKPMLKSRLPAPISRSSRFCRGLLAGKGTITFLIRLPRTWSAVGFFVLFLAAGLTSSRAENPGNQSTNLAGITDRSSCPMASNLWVTDVTDSSVMLKWDGIPGAEGYKVRYQVTGTNIWVYHKIASGSKRKLNHLLPNTSYTWEVKTYCETNPGISSGWTAKQTFTTAAAKLAVSVTGIFFDVYPNPSTSSSMISFSLSDDSRVQIQLDDITGRILLTVIDEDLSSGNHEVILNRDHLTAGIYFLQLKVNAGSEQEEVMTKKLVIE